MLDLLIAIALGGLLSMMGVALGAFLMHRATKPEQPLFGGVPQGEVFSLDDWGQGLETTEEQALPEEIQKRTNEFVDQLANRLGDKE
jgi:hypothetical protein